MVADYASAASLLFEDPVLAGWRGIGLKFARNMGAARSLIPCSLFPLFPCSLVPLTACYLFAQQPLHFIVQPRGYGCLGFFGAEADRIAHMNLNRA